MEEPFPPKIEALFARMIPPGLPPLRVLRTMARNRQMSHAMAEWMGYELSTALSVDLRAREIVIGRTCALCGCEYQWGLHMAVWAERAHFTRAQMRSIALGCSGDPCWTEPRDRLLMELAEQLHQRSDVDDRLWGDLRAHFDEEQLLDLLALCGWYHAVSFIVRAARVEPEPGLTRFADVAAPWGADR
ncbi:carboxymuconolactone decarboxylase family protein [Phytohabitans kaempferiae]|uniref:Carboxymuconolactone decarboxylase family protein n=1 Tax=Phytohabitans kaempferiae TaxID=1620943 RepID=A0ABV6LY65_9ACTN